MTIDQLRPQDQETLTHQLQTDEEVLWLSRSEPFPLLTNENKQNMLIRWVIAAVVLVALVVLCVAYAINATAYVAALILVVLFAAYFVYIPIHDCTTLSKKALYCVTNKRVLTIIPGRPTVALNSTGLHTDFVDAGNGLTHVTFGAAVGLKPAKLRSATFTPPLDDAGNTFTGIVFYNIKDVEGLKKALK